MTTTIAIIGRPNVGKSTLFNRLTSSRMALVADLPGVTRDRLYGTGTFGDRSYIFIDTGGLLDPAVDNKEISGFVSDQSLRAAREADAVFWLVDGREGMTATDEVLARSLRPDSLNLYLLVNKTEGLDVHTVCAEFHALGMGDPLPVSARQGYGISELMETVIHDIPGDETTAAEIPDGLRICFIGRPNVGKSTLVNRIIGESRMLTHDVPGTTRDSVAITFQRNNRDYVLIDTAGVRRRSRVTAAIEKFSVVKTLEAMDKAHIVIIVMDASEEIVEQDLNLVGMAVEAGKPLIIAINKWDGLDAYQKKKIKNQADRRLKFADYASVLYISALHGTGVGKMFGMIDKIGAVRTLEVKSSRITGILADAVMEHPPPLVRGRRIKLRYAHIGGNNPLRVIIHGNQIEHIPASCGRYLAGVFRKRLKLAGTPVIIEFKHGINPYENRKKTIGKSGKLKVKRKKNKRFSV